MIDDSHSRLIQILDEIRAIGQTGLNYSTDAYDRERYNRLLQIACGDLAQSSGIKPSDLSERFAREMGTITPKVGVDAAIFDAERRILLHKRSDDGRWCLPCGWVEVGESLPDAVIREVREETGFEVIPTHIIGIYDLKANIHRPHHTVAIVYLCRYLGGELTISHESIDIGYFHLDRITDWHNGHEKKAHDALRFLQNPIRFSAIKISR